MTPNFCDIRGVYPSDLGATMLTPSTEGERIEPALGVRA
jgi:protocatechuate 3,4-dioxygenase alpha subunit